MLSLNINVEKVIFGGETDNDLADDFWKFDISQQQWFRLAEDDSFK